MFRSEKKLWFEGFWDGKPELGIGKTVQRKFRFYSRRFEKMEKRIREGLETVSYFSLLALLGGVVAVGAVLIVL